MAALQPRGRNKVHAASIVRQHSAGHSTEAIGGGVFFAAPVPPTLAAKAASVSRGLKSTPRRTNSAASNNQLFHNDAVGVESSAVEQLAFDELLRLQRGRAEDVGRLIESLGASLGGASKLGGGSRRAENQQTNDKSRRAAKYREEWRVARENDILDRIRSDEVQDATLVGAERKREVEALRSYVRRSIHCFLLADRGDASASKTPRTKISNDLFYAQQMDRLLREIDLQHPLVVVRQAVADARAKFEQLLLHCSHGSDASSLLAEGLQQPHTPSREELSVKSTEQSDTDLLGLYENVVDARSMAQPTPPMVAATGKVTVSWAVPIMKTSAAFLGGLKKQREEAKSRSREALAQSHWRVVCVNRIRSTYIAYRKRQERFWRIASLQQRTRARAASVLQTVFLRAVRAFRALADARLAVQRKHQGRRISIACFWRWIYARRCQFADFQFAVTVTPETTVAIIRIQSHWRRRRAAREVAFRREFQSLRRKRRMQREWIESRRRAQMLTPVNQYFAEWHCHVAIEKLRVAHELRREQHRFTTEWTRYEARLEKDVLKAKLPSEWIPQLDPVGGETFYLNVQTTKTSSEHPNRTLLRQLLKRQRAHAEQLYEERQKRLEQYMESLDTQSVTMTERLASAYRSCWLTKDSQM